MRAGGAVIGAWLLRRERSRAEWFETQLDHVRQDTSDETRHRYGSCMDILRRLAGSSTSCNHVPEALPEAQADRCQECGSGFNLRLCATCGHVGCCESQQGHARAHALGEGHPVIYQMPAPNGFAWCYKERAYVG